MLLSGGNWRKLKCCFRGISTSQANDVEQCLMIMLGNGDGCVLVSCFTAGTKCRTAWELGKLEKT